MMDRQVRTEEDPDYSSTLEKSLLSSGVPRTQSRREIIRGCRDGARKKIQVGPRKGRGHHCGPFGAVPERLPPEDHLGHQLLIRVIDRYPDLFLIYQLEEDNLWPLDYFPGEFLPMW